MLAGDLKAGKEYIDRAIAINPDAHFGREKYQSLLAEYFLTARKSPHPASEWPSIAHNKGRFCGFAEFVLRKQGYWNGWSSAEESKEDDGLNAQLSAAQKGILGMMHFANYDSPLLLEALGDLLIAWPTNDEDAVQLAARAYYRVSQLSENQETKDEFKKAAGNMVYGHLDYINYRKINPNTKNWQDWPESDFEKLSADLNRELAEGQTYYDSIAADERRWVAQGVNLDQAFAAKYYDSLESTIEEAEKQLATERRDVRSGPYQDVIIRALLIIGTIVAGLVALVWRTYVACRRSVRNRKATTSP